MTTKTPVTGPTPVTCPTCATYTDSQWLGMVREGGRSRVRFACRCGATLHDVDVPPGILTESIKSKLAEPRFERAMRHVVGIGATALAIAILPLFGEKVVLLLPLAFFGVHAVMYFASCRRDS